MSFIFYFIYLFFLLARTEVCPFYLCFQKTLSFVSIFYSLFDLFLLFFIFSVWIISALIFMISFSLLNFGLVCSFSNYLRYKFRLFIKDLSFFSVDVYHYKFLSYYCFHSILGMLCFHLFVSMYFLSYLLSSTLTQYLFKSLLFSFHIFVNFLVFLVLLISFFF